MTNASDNAPDLEDLANRAVVIATAMEGLVTSWLTHLGPQAEDVGNAIAAQAVELADALRDMAEAPAVTSIDAGVEAVKVKKTRPADMVIANLTAKRAGARK